MRASRAATACPDGRMGARVVGSTAPEAATPEGTPPPCAVNLPILLNTLVKLLTWRVVAFEWV